MSIANNIYAKLFPALQPDYLTRRPAPNMQMMSGGMAMADDPPAQVPQQPPIETLGGTAERPVEQADIDAAFGPGGETVTESATVDLTPYRPQPADPAAISQLGDIGRAAAFGRRYEEPAAPATAIPSIGRNDTAEPEGAAVAGALNQFGQPRRTNRTVEDWKRDPDAMKERGLLNQQRDAEQISGFMDRVNSVGPLSGEPVSGAGSGRDVGELPEGYGNPPAPPPRRDKKGRPIDAKGRVIKERSEMPEFPDTPEGRLQRAEWKRENLRDEDQGFKKRLVEIIGNFLTGMSYTPDGASVKQALLLGGAGAGAGAINRTWNEQRQLDAEIPRLREAAKAEQERAYRGAQTANEQNAMANRNITTQLQIDKAVYDRLNDQQRNVLDVYKNADEIDFSTPEGAQLKAAADQAGVVLVPKKKGDRFSAQIAPDGRVVVVNTATGQYQIGTENLSKPTAITERDLPDEVFGLPTDAQLKSMATARIAPSIKSRRVRPDVLANLPAKFKNSDGTFNEAAYLKAQNEGDTSLSSADIYETLPDNDQQRVAGEVEKLRKSYDALRREVPIFRSALSNNRPAPDAENVPRAKIIALFQSIMALPAKQRAAKLDEFYKYLPNVRVQ